MRRTVWFALGLNLGALAYPCGVLVGHVLFRRSVHHPG
jgi:hypothetical protein